MDEDTKDSDTETELEENFEALLDQSMVELVRFNPGEKVEAVIIKITRDWVFIDLGSKSEGQM